MICEDCGLDHCHGAARAAARAAQEKKLRELCALCEQNPVKQLGDVK